MSSSELKTNLSARSTWLRGLYLLLFAVLYSLAELVLVAVVVFQFGATLLTGHRNARLLSLGARLSRYMYQVLRYVTFNSDTRPYPFSPWPGDGLKHGSDGEDDQEALPAGR